MCETGKKYPCPIIIDPNVYNNIWNVPHLENKRVSRPVAAVVTSTLVKTKMVHADKTNQLKIKIKKTADCVNGISQTSRSHTVYRDGVISSFRIGPTRDDHIYISDALKAAAQREYEVMENKDPSGIWSELKKNLEKVWARGNRQLGSVSQREHQCVRDHTDGVSDTL